VRKVRYFSLESLFGETRLGDSIDVRIPDKRPEDVGAGSKGESVAVMEDGEASGDIICRGAVVDIEANAWWGMEGDRSVILKLVYAKYTMRRTHNGMDFDLNDIV
jgi:hypothetical protein